MVTTFETEEVFNFFKLNQKGFATLEVILMITVLGILASTAVPRFTGITTSANTARIQADLKTLDNAIAIYEMENGKAPSNLSDLSSYVQDIDDLKPPKGKMYVEGKEENIPESYGITTKDSVTRAVIGTTITSNNVTKNSSSSSSSSSSGS